MNHDLVNGRLFRRYAGGKGYAAFYVIEGFKAEIVFLYPQQSRTQSGAQIFSAAFYQQIAVGQIFFRAPENLFAMIDEKDIVGNLFQIRQNVGGEENAAGGYGVRLRPLQLDSAG